MLRFVLIAEGLLLFVVGLILARADLGAFWCYPMVVARQSGIPTNVMMLLYGGIIPVVLGSVMLLGSLSRRLGRRPS
jgi:hypothetical protein